MKPEQSKIDTRPILEELEPRQLFSGGLEGVIIEESLAEPAIYMDIGLETSQNSDSDVIAQTSEQVTIDTRQELVFIDTDVENYQELLNDILAQDSEERNIEVIVLDNERDGIEQISEALANYQNLDAVHLISHSSDGNIDIGNTLLDANALNQNLAEISGWGDAFSEQGDFLIYGCNLAATENGQSLVQTLSSLTQTDVAASDDLTGHESLGGDWDLEVNTGTIESQIAVSAEVQQNWVGLLDITTGLDAHYSFDLFPTDSSGNAYDGTLTNGAVVDTTPATNQIGSGKLSLDGVNDYVNLDAHLSNFDSLTTGTISAWVKTTGGSQWIFSASDSGDSNSDISLRLDSSGHLQLDVWEGGAVLAVETTATVNDGNWHHVAATVGPGGNALYIDGVQASVNYLTGNSSSTAFFDDVTNLDSMSIGRYLNDSGSQFHFDGLIDDVRVYDRALSTDDVAKLYSYTGAPPANVTPVVDLDADDSSGATGTGYAINFIEGAGSVPIADSDTTITDADDTEATSLTVNFSGVVDGTDEHIIVAGHTFQVGVAEVVVLNHAGVDLEFDFDGEGFAIELDGGGTVDLSVFESLLQDFRYENISDAPTSGTRMVSVFVLDPGLESSAASTSTVTVSAVNPKILFWSNRDGNQQIYSMDADGSNQINISDNAFNDSQPRWSPDGSRVIFKTTRDGNMEIYVMNADGSNPINLTNDVGIDRYPSWSPDGSQIVFDTTRDGGNRDIYVMDADGSNPTRLTTDAAVDYGAHWSPDGTQIVFATQRDGGDQIYVMDADGSNQTRLTNTAAANYHARFSPDGTQIVFMSQRDGNDEVYVMDADGSNQTRLTNNAATDTVPYWSPDGTQIVFMSNRDGNQEIYVMDADGSNQTNVSNTPGNEGEPSWGESINDNPDITNLGGDSLAYTEGDGAQVIDQATNAAVADVDSSNFDTGTLTVSFAAGSDSAEDVLAIRDQGAGPSNITLSGSAVSYGGTQIGTFTGGSGGADLVITLDSDADATATAALIQNITYENTDTANPTPGARTVRYALTDGDRGTSANYDTTVTVSGADDAAVITGDVSFVGNEGDVVAGDLNATDVEGLTDATYFTVSSAATKGTAVIDADTGAWSFTPTDSNWFGSDSFTVTVTDDLGGTTNQVISITLANVNNSTLWMTTEQDVASPSGANGLDSWTGGSVLSFDDPNLAFDPGVTDGTLSNVFNLDNFIQDGDSRLDAIHYVGTNMTVGTNAIALQAGDILLSSVFNETLVNSDASTLAVTSRDVFIFRADSLADYSLGGTFIKLIDGADLSVEIEGITLVEQATTVGIGGGATTLNPGDFLFTDRDNSSVIYRLQPGILGSGATNTGTITVLVDGTDIGINQLIHGVELVESDVTIGDRTLTSGQLLISLYADDVVAGTSVSRSDIFILNVTGTGATTSATAEAFFTGGDIGFDTWQESPWAVSLVPTAINSPTIATFQQGVDGYTGTQDTFLDEFEPTADKGNAVEIAIDLFDGGSDATTQGLISFDNIFGSGPGQIPFGATINSASLEVNVTNVSDPGAQITLHQMLMNWNESSTWNTTGSGVQTNDAEAASTAASTLGDPATSGAQTFTGLEATLQAWSDGATNYGWVIVSDSDNGWDFASSEAVVASERPQLTISYTLATSENDLSVATNDTAVTDENTAVIIDLTTNDTDAESDSITVLDVGNPANGTVVNNNDGTVTYTPNNGFTGADSFSYVASDLQDTVSYWQLDGDATDSVGSNDGVVTGTTTVEGNYGNAMQFDEVDDHVVISDFAMTTDFSVSFDIKIDDNSGSLFQYIYSHGAVGTANSLNIFLLEDSHGTDPNMLRTNFADINDTPSNTALEFDASSIIGDGLWHTYTLTISSGGGASVYLDGVLKNSDGTLGGDAFDPTTDIYLGGREDLNVDRFFGGGLDSVQIFDRRLSAAEVTAINTGGSAIGTVDVTVNVANSAPIATGNTVIATEDVPLVIGLGDFNFTDAEGDGLTSVTITGLTLNGGTLTHSAGAVTVTNGMVVTAAQLADLTFTSALNDSTNSSFTYTVNDAGLGVTSATMNITVTQIDDAGTFGGNTSATTNEDTATAGTVTFADTADGFTTANFSINTAATNGVAAIDAAGNWTYTPTLNYNGADSFTVQVTDDDGNVETQVISLTVTANNDAGTFGGITSATTNEDTATAGTVTFADTADGFTTANFSINTAAANGVAGINAAGDWTYTPTLNYNGADSFTVQVTDDDGNVETQVISITVTATDDAAIITGDISYVGNEGDVVAGDLNATDVDGLTDTTYFTVSSAATNGTAIIDADTGAWSFTPADSNWFGSDSFTVTVTDDLGGTTNQVISITLANVDDAAVITGNVSFVGNEGDVVAGDLNATDVEGLTDTTYFTVSSAATNGTAVIDADTGAWSFTPSDPNWFGSDSFTVTVTDDLGGTTNQVINITLANVDDDAVITGDISYSGNEGDAVVRHDECYRCRGVNRQYVFYHQCCSDQRHSSN